MRKTQLAWLVVLGCCWSSVAHAEPSTPLKPGSVEAPLKPASVEALQKARALKKDGLELTVGGLVLETVGLGLLTGAALMPSCAFVLGAAEEGRCAQGGSGSNTAVYGLFFAGLATSVLATAMLAGGVPMLSVGAHREKRLQLKAMITPTGIVGTF